MFHSSDDCLSDEQLDELEVGRALDPAVVEHIERCGACRERLAGRSHVDAFLASVAASVRHVRDVARTQIPAAGLPCGSFDGYESIEEVERGGQGVVFRGVHTASRRVVALKVVKVGSSRNRARLEREARLAARLRHPSIVAMHDCGAIADGRFAIVMEWVDGVPLDVWARGLRTDPSLPSLERRGILLRLFAKICDAIEHAHRNGVLHRDLKPENILVDRAGEPRILDFGIATELDARPSVRVTMTGEVACTLSYAAPEQLAGDAGRADTRSDVYSLGVLLFQLLTDRLPFESERGIAHLLDRITHEVPTPPSKCQAPQGAIPINHDLDTIVGKALARDPDRRYASALSLQKDVEHLLRGEPIDARRDSLAYLVRMTLRRYRLGVAVGGVVLTALIAGAIAVSLAIVAGRESALREASERQRMESEAKRSAAVAAILREVIPIGNPVPMAAESSDAHRALSAISENLEMGLFADDTAAVVATRLAVADVSADRGALRWAEVEYRQALRVLAERAWPDDTLKAKVQTHLARLLSRRSSVDEADRLIDEALPELVRLLGPSHPDSLEALAVRAEVSLAQGEPDQARVMLDELRSQIRPGDNLTVAREAEVRLRALGDGGSPSERAALSLRLVRAVMTEFGDGDERLLRAIATLAADGAEPLRSMAASFLGALGQKPLAVAESETIERLVELKRAILGPDDPDLIESQVRVAQRALEEFRADAARAPAADAIRIAMPSGVASTVGQLDLLFLQFRARSLSSEPDEAFEGLDAMLAGYRELLGRDGPLHLITRLRECAFACAWTGRAALSRQLYGEAIERATAISPTSPHRAWSQVEASRCELYLGDAERGLELIEAAIAALEHADPSWSWHRSQAVLCKGQILSLAGRPAEAIAAIERGEQLLLLCDLPKADREAYRVIIAKMLDDARAGRVAKHGP